MPEDISPADALRATIAAAEDHEPLPAEAAQEANPPTTPTGSAPSAATAPPTLRQGATGAPVRAWQERLCALGYEPGKADGAFGPKTLAATQAFQASRGLASSGVVDAATWAEGYQAAHKDMTLSRVMLARAQRDVGLREEGANNHGARVEQMNEIDVDPQKPAVDGTTNKLDRSTAWGGPTNLAGGDAGSRTNSMGQPTASGAVF
jgi:hypothetical protein